MVNHEISMIFECADSSSKREGMATESFFADFFIFARLKTSFSRV